MPAASDLGMMSPYRPNKLAQNNFQLLQREKINKANRQGEGRRVLPLGHLAEVGRDVPSCSSAAVTGPNACPPPPLGGSWVAKLQPLCLALALGFKYTYLPLNSSESHVFLLVRCQA